MKTRTSNFLKAIAIAVASLTLAAGAQAQGRGGFHGGGGGGHFAHGGPGGFHGGGHYYGRRGPSRGFLWGGLGLGIGLGLGSYYAWPGYYYSDPGYVTVDPPVVYSDPQPVPSSSSPQPVIYPRNGQNAAQTDADANACSQWAGQQPNATSDPSVFQRAISACMDGRGYTVR